MKASEITEAGLYWYFAHNAVRPAMVEIGPAEAPKADWQVFFPKQEHGEPLFDATGVFIGPVMRGWPGSAYR